MAAPEDGAQRDVVAQLALPIAAGQTRDEARRVQALQARITVMDPRNAQRLYERLTSSADALGNVFHLTLHHVTVNLLLGQLDRKRHEIDPGTTPAARVTDGHRVSKRPPTPEPPKPQSTEHRVPTPDRDNKEPVRTSPPGRPYVVPQPWMQDENQVPDPAGSSSRSWIGSSLMAAAGVLGMTFSVGLRSVSAAAMEKALEAAWLVFQVTDGEPAALVGRAGEAAAEAFLSELQGVDPSSVRNLNTLQPNFPVLDLISPRAPYSVKNRGALSTLPAWALDKQVRSTYTSDLLDLITGEGKIEDAAEALLRHRHELGSAWPNDLRATTVEGVSKYLREKTVLLVPSDHVQPLRRSLGEDLARRLTANQAGLDRLGITNQRQLANFVSRQVDRIQSIGPSSGDFRVMAEAAAHHLPPEVNEKFRKKFADILKRTKQRAGK